MPTITLTPPIPQKRPYEIIVEAGAITRMQECIDRAGSYDAACIIYDARMEEAATELKNSITQRTILIPVPSGEESKSLREVEHIVEKMIENNATRQSLVIALGGGMVTDLGGFVAATFMRGIDVILVPTSLLGMVDAAIGGKNGVDCGGIKNSVGTYHQPSAIVADIDFLATLPDEQFCQGLVEAIKVAAIADEKAFAWYEKHLPAVLRREANAVIECIAHAARMKGEAVQNDEKDRDSRLMLNFGHTVGHAVEALSQFKISHGDAVSIGMVAEMIIAINCHPERSERKQTQTKDVGRITALLEKLKRPTEIPRDMDNDDLWSLMEHDKKAKNGVRIAVPSALGTGTLMTITKDQFLRARI